MSARPTLASPSAAETLDATRCPLCGAANGCALEAARASGQPPAPCWCLNARFSDALRARVPAVARERACICAHCAAAAGDPAAARTTDPGAAPSPLLEEPTP